MMALDQGFPSSLSSGLENLFFLKEDQKLIEKLRTMKKINETKEELSKVSGIKNEKILQKLVDLKVRPETLASITLVPLVEVAWADGSVDDSETKAVLDAMEEMGFSKGGNDYEIVVQWMTHQPAPELLEAWTHYIQGLCEQLSPEEKKTLRHDITGHTRDVAMASGGFLGLGNKISEEESLVLARMERAFD
jgi:hypothetical protein